MTKISVGLLIEIAREIISNKVQQVSIQQYLSITLYAHGVVWNTHAFEHHICNVVKK